MDLKELAGAQEALLKAVMTAHPDQWLRFGAT
jgi:hypothetical protein